MTSTLHIDTDHRHVTTITLNRPEVRNAFDDRMIRELGAALADIDADSATRCVVITGAGTAFCAGGDIEWMRSTASFGELENIRDARVLAGLMATLNGLSKPTIARVNGHAFGAGFIYGYVKGWDWRRAARLGNACGAIVVTEHGCANFMPTLDEVMAFADGRGGL